ncbi:MAG: hypothetical protein WCP21_20165, partial [Armatimonadota bacterium]
MLSFTPASVVLAIGEQPLGEAWSAAIQQLGLATRLATTEDELAQELRDQDLLLVHPSYPQGAVRCLSLLRERGYRGKAIVVTPTPSIPEAVALLGLGCQDYLPASLPADRVARTVAESAGQPPGSPGAPTWRSTPDMTKGTERGRPPFQLLWQSFRKRHGHDHIHSISHPCQQLYAQAAQAAPAAVTV